MKSLRLHLTAQIVLWSLLLMGLVVRFFVRAPEGTAAGEIYEQVELTGRAQEITNGTVRLVRSIASKPDTVDQAEKASRLANVNAMKEAAERVRTTIQETNSNWLQLKEAAPLMSDCEKLLQLAISRVLTSPDSAIKPQENPALVETPSDTIPVLQARAQQLEDQAARLSARMKQAITKGVFAQGSWLGFTAADMLLAALTISTLLASAVLIQASRRLRTPLAKLERTELELLGRSDRRKALRQCHGRVQELLELAGGFCRSDRT